MSKETDDDKRNMKSARKKFEELKTSVNTDSYLYIIIKHNGNEKNKFSRLEYLQMIQKIGETASGVSREITYIPLNGLAIMIKLLCNSQKTVLHYAERITTANLNISNLKGCRGGPNRIHIDPKIISYVNQNWLSVSFFEESFTLFNNSQ